jgi:hypothetical protein
VAGEKDGGIMSTKEPEGSGTGASDEKDGKGRWGPERGAAEGSRRRREGVDIFKYKLKKKRGSRRRAGRKGVKHDVENRVLLWEKRGKYENLPIVVYFSLAKASDRIRVATETVNEAIRIPVIGNKRRTNATQPGKLRPKPSPRQII